MKSLSFILLASSLLWLQPVRGQERQPQTPEQRAARITEWMKTNLALSETQLPQVEQINLKYANQAEALRKSEGTRKQRMSSLRKEDHEKDKELKAILSESQFQTYLSKKEELKELYKKKMKEKQAGG